MARAVDTEFDSWLRKKLIDLNTDDEVFSPYILGILESDDSSEEKRESLHDILSEIIESNISDLCSEILQKWSDFNEKLSKEISAIPQINVDEKLAKLMEESKVPTTQVTLKTSTEQQKLKEAILAQYAEVSDGEVTDDDDVLPAATANMGLTKNTNAETVARAEREKREKDKEDSQKKKEKDKEDRAKQKTKDEDRKEKEKKRTQKGERRR